MLFTWNTVTYMISRSSCWKQSDEKSVDNIPSLKDPTTQDGIKGGVANNRIDYWYVVENAYALATILPQLWNKECFLDLCRSGSRIVDLQQQV